MTDAPGPTPPTSRRITLARAVELTGVALLGVGGAFVALGLLTLVFGDAMTDAAPWWLFFVLVGLCLAVPGGVALLGVRLRARSPRLAPAPPGAPSDRG